jgi:phosphoglucosamine mutase
MSRALFGTDGIRGRAGAFPLDEATLVGLGRVISGLAAGRKVLIGRDGRESGAAIEAQLARGLGRRVQVHSCGLVPTPGLAFLTRTLGFHFGIMITASHNPYADNGIKIFDRRGEKISAAMERRIGAALKTAGRRAGAAPVVRAVDPGHEYLDFLAAAGRGLKPDNLRIVVDCANGAAAAIAPALFRRLGLDARVRHARPDGRNINAGCGSTCPQTLARLVREENADLGLALDGDADRVIFADSRGGILDGDHALFVLGLFLQRSEPRFNGRVIGTVMTNLALESALAARGMTLQRADVGDSQVARLMRRGGAILGGEPSGHIILRHVHSTGDGLLASLFFMKALSRLGWSGLDARRRLLLFPQRVVNVPVSRRRDLARWTALLRAREEFAARHGDRARLLIRYSGTEPLVRIMMEARDVRVIEADLPRFTALIQDEIGVQYET